MKPAPFNYLAPATLDEALAALAEHGWDAKVLAGGQSLIPTMNFRMAQPAVLIDINRIPDLAYIKPADDHGLLLGATTRQARLERDETLARHAPLIHEAMPSIAHPQIRNRGTLGGSIAHADPSAELPAVTTALKARYRLRNHTGERWVEAADFYQGLFATALEPEDLLVEVAIPPLPARTGCAFKEVSRRHGDYAMCGAATVVTLAEDGTCIEARIVFFSVGETPTLALEAGALLEGQPLTDDLIAEAAALAAEKDIDPTGDIHATPAYRRHLARALARDTLTTARDRA